MDRISNLPDEMICHIGTFLSAKDAAFAMVLSRRWKNLFTIIPILRFYYRSQESFSDFADQVFALPANSRINNFSLFWKFEDIEPAHINRCLSHALKHHGVADLDLKVMFEEEEHEDRYSVPLEVFTCKTLSKLSLGFGSVIGFLPMDAFLPSLKTIILDSVRFEEPSAFNMLLSASHVLEELDISGLREWKWSPCTVSSPTIKRLTIHHEFPDDDFEYESISFDTPALTYLNYSDFARKEYPIVNLNSLVKAELDICKDEDIQSDPTNLFNGLKNVEILRATDETMDLIHEIRAALAVFENLSHLTLVCKQGCCWSGLRVLLQKSPNLKTLTILRSLHLHYDEFNRSDSEPLCKCLLGYSFLSSCRIEVLKITEFEGGDAGAMLHLKYILENLPYLELCEIHLMIYDDGNKAKQIEKNLLTIHFASSSKCKIKFFSRFHEV